MRGIYSTHSTTFKQEKPKLSSNKLKIFELKDMVAELGVKLNQISPDTMPKSEEKSLIGNSFICQKKTISLLKRPLPIGCIKLWSL